MLKSMLRALPLAALVVAAAVYTTACCCCGPAVTPGTDTTVGLLEATRPAEVAPPTAQTVVASY